MNQPTPIDIINHCIAHNPQALGIIAFGPRVKKVVFAKVSRPPSACHHRPSGIENPVGIVGGCPCGAEHSALERCAVCGQSVPYHDFPGRELRRAMVLAEMPERIGVNLKGPAENQDFMIMFVVDRTVYDSLQRQAASGLILPPGVTF